MDSRRGQETNEPVPQAWKEVVTHRKVHAWKNRQHHQKQIQLSFKNAQQFSRIYRIQIKKILKKSEKKMQRHL